MQTYPLVPHPDHPPAAVTKIEARIIGSDATWLRARWRIEGSGALIVPPFAGKGRAHELWTTTCFELFLKPSRGNAYVGVSLSPPVGLYAYDLVGYREGMS